MDQRGAPSLQLKDIVIFATYARTRKVCEHGGQCIQVKLSL